jgi:hypothetical protein
MIFYLIQNELILIYSLNRKLFSKKLFIINLVSKVINNFLK